MWENPSSRRAELASGRGRVAAAAAADHAERARRRGRRPAEPKSLPGRLTLRSHAVLARPVIAD